MLFANASNAPRWASTNATISTPITAAATPVTSSTRSHHTRRSSRDGYDVERAAAAAAPTSRAIGTLHGGYSTRTRHAPSHPLTAASANRAYTDRARVAASNAAPAKAAYPIDVPVGGTVHHCTTGLSTTITAMSDAVSTRRPSASASAYKPIAGSTRYTVHHSNANARSIPNT